MNNLKELFNRINDCDTSFMEEAKKESNDVIVGKTNFVKNKKVKSEKEYKLQKTKKHEIMYHFHFCYTSIQEYQKNIISLEKMLKDAHLKLDRFGVSIDPAMALPEAIRKKHKSNSSLYFENSEDWNKLALPKMMQAHLGDNMIGSPASYELVKNALSAGITTIGNMSQFFGYDYPEYTDVEERTKSTVKSIILMAKHKNDGTLIHSNLDDGYGSVADDLGILTGLALIEKYIVEDLLDAKLAHSFGDMLHSPMKRLILLSALNKINNGQMCGSMIFTNKLGRNKKHPELNAAHLSECLIFDMAGQYHYKTGHAVTVMADNGLNYNVTNEEVIRCLSYARELESYIPQVVKIIDFASIDKYADEVVKRGTEFKNNVFEYLTKYIDIRNPYILLLTLKKAGIKNIIDEVNIKNDQAIQTDYKLFEH